VEMMEKQNINRRVFCIGLRVSSDSFMQVVFTKQIRWIAYMSRHGVNGRSRPVRGGCTDKS
jgi:hypothetical protein